MWYFQFGSTVGISSGLQHYWVFVGCWGDTRGQWCHKALTIWFLTPFCSITNWLDTKLIWFNVLLTTTTTVCDCLESNRNIRLDGVWLYVKTTILFMAYISTVKLTTFIYLAKYWAFTICAIMILAYMKICEVVRIKYCMFFLFFSFNICLQTRKVIVMSGLNIDTDNTH